MNSTTEQWQTVSNNREWWAVIRYKPTILSFGGFPEEWVADEMRDYLNVLESRAAEAEAKAAPHLSALAGEIADLRDEVRSLKTAVRQRDELLDECKSLSTVAFLARRDALSPARGGGE